MIKVLFLTLTAWSVVTGEPCQVRPPYHGIAIARITYTSAETAAILRASLKHVCGLHPLYPEEPTGESSDVLLLARAHRRLLAGDVRAHVDVLDVDLGASIAHEAKEIAPYSPGIAVRASGAEGSGGTQSPLPTRCGDVKSDNCLRADHTMKTTYYSRYHTYDDLVDHWKALNTSRSALRLEVYGRSVEGRPLHLLRVGRTPADRPVRVIFTCMLHAREWVTTMAGLFVADGLSASVGGGGALSRLLQSVEAIVLPLVNPDGYVYTHTTNRIWRKNRQRNICTAVNETRVGGIDLNRNWGIDFDGSSTTSSNPCSNVYKGKKAFSAPETAAVRDLVLRTPGIKGHIDIHSYGQLVLGPWVHSPKEPPNASVIDHVGEMMRRALSSGGEEYRYGRGRTSPLYLASGTATDWFFGRGVLSYTFELRPSLEKENGLAGFLLAKEQILPACQETLAAMEVFMKNIAGLPGMAVETPALKQRREVIKNALTAVGIVVALVFVGVIACWVLRRKRSSSKALSRRSNSLLERQSSTVDIENGRALDIST